MLQCNLSVEQRFTEHMNSFGFIEEFVFAAVYFSALIWLSMNLVSGYIYLVS
ncbi:putative membrane protein [Synechococcus sp. MIT S9220]|nr:putative membrane protein [Synechococcus sp. MIT S9220]